MIEAAWGLGEVVVSGAVTPDRYHLDRSGQLTDFAPGHKDIKIWFGDGHGTIECAVADDLHGAPCLDALQLASLHRLAEQCERVWGPRLDIEWAVDQVGGLHLLQCRPITV